MQPNPTQVQTRKQQALTYNDHLGRAYQHGNCAIMVDTLSTTRTYAHRARYNDITQKKGRQLFMPYPNYICLLL